MKLQTKIPIDFKDFFKSGKFDFIKIGKTKDWILNNFPDPDFLKQNPEIRNSPIWNYGNLEFHFHQDTLFMIFSDDIKELNGGESLELNKWFLDETSELTLINIIKKLIDEKINFDKKSNVIVHPSVQLKLESGVTLAFIVNEKDNENYDDYLKRCELTNENEFELYSFNLS